MTDRLYQTDSYRTEFEALVSNILTTDGRPGVVLEGTFFYPESGGQPCDTGSLGGIGVEAVVEEGDTIVHVLDGEPGFRRGDRVKGVVDWHRRFINMQQHTGQHILSQAFEQVLGARTVSSSLGTQHSTIDISRLGLTWEDMAAVEAVANRIVYENRPVKVYEAPRDGAGELRMKKPVRESGGETARGTGADSAGRAGKPEREILRIVEVEGFDRSPCGGTHVRTTGETGCVKILRWEKVRDTTRVEFICGALAEEDYFWKNRFVVDLAQRLTTKDTNLPALVDGMLEDNKALRREAERLRAEVAGFRVEEMRDKAERISGVSIIATIFEDLDAAGMRRAAATAVKRGPAVALFCLKGEKVQFVFARSEGVSVDMREVMRAACEVVGGTGGGKADVAQGGGDRAELAEEALARGLDIVRAGLADMG